MGSGSGFSGSGVPDPGILIKIGIFILKIRPAYKKFINLETGSGLFPNSRKSLKNKPTKFNQTPIHERLDEAALQT